MLKAPIPPDLRWEVWLRDNFTCQKCRVRKHLTIDHIFPESKGGKTESTNLQTLCKPCNSRKSNKFKAVFLPTLKLGPINCNVISEVYDVAEAAKLIGIGYATIYRWIKQGKIRTIRLGHRTLIPKSEVATAILNESA